MKSNRTPVFYAAIVKNLIKKIHLLSHCVKYRNFTSNLGADILWKCTVYAEFCAIRPRSFSISCNVCIIILNVCYNYSQL